RGSWRNCRASSPPTASAPRKSCSAPAAWERWASAPPFWRCCWGSPTRDRRAAPGPEPQRRSPAPASIHHPVYRPGHRRRDKHGRKGRSANAPFDILGRREVRASVEIYLDNAATTPPLPEVIEAVNHVLKTAWGNPSSVHTKGVEAERIVAAARRNVAAALRARPDESLFTSGGTEANALAIKGAARARAGRYRHVITAATEHPSVFNAVESLEDEGFSVTVLPVDSEGRVRVEDVLAALRDDTGLVTLMWVNNEVGTLHPVAEIARAVKERRPDVWLHFDAVQAFGKVPIRLDEVPADLLTVSGHKIHGPKGVGALFVREGVRLAPLFGPGTQEKGIRPGTENVPGIAGFGVAAKAAADMPAEMEKTRALKNLLWERIAAAVPFAVRNGPADEAASAPHILSVS